MTTFFWVMTTHTRTNELADHKNQLIENENTDQEEKQKPKDTRSHELNEMELQERGKTHCLRDFSLEEQKQTSSDRF